MDLLVTSVGAILILLGGYDIFRTLFIPSGKGVLSKVVAQFVWRGFRRVAVRNPSSLDIAGPAVFTATAGTWVVLLLLGWACVYWPSMPDAFSYSPGLVPEANAGFLDALYLSMVTLGTLGYGDITPSSNVIRLVSSLQGLAGFGLVTAVISWLLSIYPDLALRSSFAHQVSLLQRIEEETGTPALSTLDPTSASRMMMNFSSELVTIRGDLEQFPVTYYFHSTDRRSSLPAVMLYLLDLANRGSDPNHPEEVRFHARMLQSAIDDLGQTLADRFLGLSSSESTAGILEQYARDHFQREPTSGG